MKRLNLYLLAGAASSMALGLSAAPACAKVIFVRIGGFYIVPSLATDVTVLITYKGGRGTGMQDVPFGPFVLPGETDLVIYNLPDPGLVTASFVKWTYRPVKKVNLSAIYAADIPEPAPWAMMLVGFGGLGAALRASLHSRRLTFRRPDVCAAGRETRRPLVMPAKP